MTTPSRGIGRGRGRPGPPKDVLTCEQCRNQFTAYREKRGRVRRFCSPDCYRDWQTGRPTSVPCAMCQKPTSYRKNRNVCDSCYQQWMEREAKDAEMRSLRGYDAQEIAEKF